MPPARNSSAHTGKFVNDLIVHDARSLPHGAGGELSLWQLPNDLIAAGAASALTARAIWSGGATGWNLALLAVLPPIYAVE